MEGKVEALKANAFGKANLGAGHIEIYRIYYMYTFNPRTASKENLSQTTGRRICTSARKERVKNYHTKIPQAPLQAVGS